jgi:hypothetical protein
MIRQRFLTSWVVCQAVTGDTHKRSVGAHMIINAKSDSVVVPKIEFRQIAV